MNLKLLQKPCLESLRLQRLVALACCFDKSRKQCSPAASIVGPAAGNINDQAFTCGFGIKCKGKECRSLDVQTQRAHATRYCGKLSKRSTCSLTARPTPLLPPTTRAVRCMTPGWIAGGLSFCSAAMRTTGTQTLRPKRLQCSTFDRNRPFKGRTKQRQNRTKPENLNPQA